MASLIDQIVSVRHYIPSKQPEIYNRAYRTLVTKSYKRTRPRKIFKTPSSSEPNPVYVIEYSPNVFPDHRVIAAGDEHGYLSILRAKLEVKRKSEKLDPNQTQDQFMEQMELIRRDTTALSIPSTITHPDDPSPPIQPILYSLSWNSTGTKIVAGYGDGMLRIWDLGKDTPVNCFSSMAYSKGVKRVAWAENDAAIISCSRTNEICVHDNRMRNPLANKIDCEQVHAKLSDISVIHPYMLSCSSNQRQVLLWDLRKTYKLYKKVCPVERFDLGCLGYTNMAFDKTVDDKVFAYGSDSKVRSLNWRTGTVGTTYKVPNKVDYFSKLDVDCVADVMVCGTSGTGAYLFDLSKTRSDDEVLPFWELNSHKKQFEDDNGEKEKDLEVDKENDDLGIARSCCAVALGKRRQDNDGFVQISTGGDDTFVTVWD